MITLYIALTFNQPVKVPYQFDIPKITGTSFFDNQFLNFCKNTGLTYANEQRTLLAMSQIEIQNRNMFLKMLLLLSGNVEVNPEPTHLQDDNAPLSNYEKFKCRGMHFLHLNINSVLPKIDELCLIAKKHESSHNRVD